MEARRRALGRGLGALIPISDEDFAAAENRLESREDGSVPIGAIQPNPYQPRESWDETAIRELADSIREKGVLQPLLVRRVGDSYQLIAGERRFRAAQLAGLERVPVTLRDVDDRESLELALVENLQRENLNPIEEARAFQQLSEEFSLTQDEIAQRVGKSRSAVANSLRLLQLPPEIREQLRTGKLSAGHARSLLAIPSPVEQAEAAQLVINHSLSVRDTEGLARRHQQRADAAVDVDRLAVESELSSALGTRVRIRARKGEAGRIEIEYYSLAELNGIVARIIGERQTAVAF